MGYDQPDGIVASRNVVRNLLMADYVLTSGDYMTRHMYEGGYRLGNVFAGEVIDEGGPRTDRQVLDATGRGGSLPGCAGPASSSPTETGSSSTPRPGGAGPSRPRATTPRCW